MAVNRIKALVHADLEAVNALIIEKIQSEISLVDDLSHHIIQSGGKRLRPLLVLLSAYACGYTGQGHIALAAMVEFFHTATLLHDDVLDSSTLRRGQETANEIWGSKASILVGDYLYTQAIEIIVQENNPFVLRMFSKIAHEITCGELKQLLNRHNFDLSIAEYLAIITAKTGLLFAAAAAIGAQLCYAVDNIKQNLYNYGLHLGNAFQLIDDALDYCSDKRTIGKNIGDDLAEGKITLPLLHALRKGSNAQQQVIKNSIREGNLDNLANILTILQETKAIEFTRNYAAQEIQLALSALQVAIPDSIYKTALCDLTHFALNRDH